MPPRAQEYLRTDTLDYIQAMLGQLRIMADADRHDMLAYLIEIAYLEASDIIRGERPARSNRPGPSTQQKRNTAA